MSPYTLYLVTDEHLSLNALVEVVEQAIAGGVTMVQLREKHHDVRAFIERANAIHPICQAAQVPLIINDRVDVALAVGADGVHLGQSDMPATYARRLLGPNKLLGLSIESWKQLEEAKQLPIDYIGLSAIYPTPTKLDTQHHWGLDGLAKALQAYPKPIVAIGGIRADNLANVASTGVQGIALVSALCAADSPKQAAQSLLREILSARE
ncbi:thiamine phosphate synthase [Marinomonas ostreistagni]|uniref:thiamine phosphate synthase n=1 Tax=Marinomonas ostreistagni TaxID=359209 RepID=UPI00194E600C|nr:thiamine phosphate synthase [Marinomonas ostreistagni]MBM6551870.1 thiamine phosphate synthase [Marinomonas ostreistagni]